MVLREKQEKTEDLILGPFAAKSSETKGRQREEEKCDIRTDFQRDRDRIIHCKAFRRMKHKTQVFISPEGDHKAYPHVGGIADSQNYSKSPFFK